MTYKDVVTALRASKSKSYHGLFQEAADMIEALVADLQNMGRIGSEFCDLCAHGQNEQIKQWCAENALTCDDCPHDCPCKNCRNADLFEWRGLQKDSEKKQGGHNNGI